MAHGYQVFCAGKKGSRWVPYSKVYPTQTEAAKSKSRAEERRICCWKTGELIRYKIKVVGLG